MKKYLYIGIPIVITLLLIWNTTGGQQSSSEQKIGTHEGNIAPSFIVTTIAGESFSIPDIKGKALVITSAAAWCSTCVMEAQQFAPVYEKYKDADVVFLTIDIDPKDTVEGIQAFRTHTNTPWVYADAAGAAQLIKDYSLSRFEITYVIDKDGIVRYKDDRITDSQTLDGVLNGVQDD